MARKPLSIAFEEIAADKIVAASASMPDELDVEQADAVGRVTRRSPTDTATTS